MTQDDVMELLRKLHRIRQLELTVSRLKRQGEVFSLIHLSMGGEGVAVGTCSQLRTTDIVYSGHRAHGHAVAKGVPLEGLIAELMGRASGVCQGMGGSMHLVDVEHGFFGATGVVGGNIPIALGSALAKRRQGTDDVVVVLFGDGAVQTGAFHETMNLAALWALPIVFVCENNGYAEFTPRSAHTTVPRVADVVQPYDMRSATVNGTDVLAVGKAFAGMVEAARRGHGPALLECDFYRLRGHYEGDADQYREKLSEEELDQKDPLRWFARQGLEEGWFTAADADLAQEQAERELASAVANVRGDELPTWDLAQRLTFKEVQR